jgi:hypothetical protein
MTEDEEFEPEGEPRNDPPPVVDPVRRSALKGPGGDTEKALGLEVARLFGLSPRLLVSRPSRPEGRSAPQEEDAPEGGSEALEDGHSGD